MASRHIVIECHNSEHSLLLYLISVVYPQNTETQILAILVAGYIMSSQALPGILGDALNERVNCLNVHGNHFCPGSLDIGPIHGGRRLFQRWLLGSTGGEGKAELLLT